MYEAYEAICRSATSTMHAIGSHERVAQCIQRALRGTTTESGEQILAYPWAGVAGGLGPSTTQMWKPLSERW